MTPKMMPYLFGAQVAGTSAQVIGSLEEGKQVQQVRNARASVDLANAKAVERAGVEKAILQEEEGQRLLATQKSLQLSNGVMSSLVIEAETKAAINRDKGFTLENANTEATAYRNSAMFEKAMGKQARKKSIWDAVTSGVQGGASLAYMGYKSGIFKKKDPFNGVKFTKADYTMGADW